MSQYTRGQRSRRHSHDEPLQWTVTLKRAFFYLAHEGLTPLKRFYRFLCYTVDKPRDGRRIALSWLVQNLLTFVNLIITIWLWVVFWGEIGVFNESIAACRWSSWERWVSFFEYTKSLYLT